MRRRGQSGLTLVEVLIAVSLVSLLSVGMLFAIRAGLTAMESSSRRMVANRRAGSAQSVLQAQVAGFLPVLAKCGALPMENSGGTPAPFFQGLPGVARFITTYSLEGASRGLPQAVELFLIPGEAGRGVRLVVNETPYHGPVGAGFLCGPPMPDPITGANLPQFPPPRPSPRSFVLADKLAYCRFSYLQEIEPTPEMWVPAWTRTDRWPKAIRIEMAPLDADAFRIAPMTFTGRIRPNRVPFEQYEY